MAEPSRDQMARAFLSTRPALRYVLGLDEGGLAYWGPRGYSCEDCPLRDPAPSYEERQGVDISNDRSEAHYDCTLLNRKVWGEDTPCTEKDWQRRAQAELGIEPEGEQQ